MRRRSRQSKEDGTDSVALATTDITDVTATAALTEGTFVVHLFCIKATVDTA
ncbi:MAG: hypothetical protein WC904_10930 [Proteiniphilum sp.]